MLKETRGEKKKTREMKEVNLGSLVVRLCLQWLVTLPHLPLLFCFFFLSHGLIVPQSFLILMNNVQTFNSGPSLVSFLPTHTPKCNLKIQ